ncbi:MAG: tetratricopeptide repeat protein [Bryobacterales bacterium]|nr:tetratricopeptide repeat protein [Bryobacterales bacterium]
MGRKNKRGEVAAPIPSAAAAVAPASPWILGPARDMLLFIAAPLLVIAVFLPMRAWLSSRQIAILLLAFFTFGHHFPGFLRAYGDRELFSRYKWRFLVAPPALFCVAYWFNQEQLHGLLVFVSLWDIWHVLMQHYGFMRIYDSKVGAVSPTGSWMDWALSISWYVTLIAVSPHYSYSLLSRGYQAGLPVISTAALQGLRTTLLSMSALLTLAYVGYHLNEWREGRPVSWRKLLMLGIFLGATYYLYVFLDDFLVGFTVWSAFHCIQYYGIVWVYNRNRVKKNGPVAAFVRFLFRPSAGLVLFYAGLILAYGAINYFTAAVTNVGLQKLLIAFVVTSNALHYYYDGFIWKVRDRATRADLDIADAASAPAKAKAWAGQLIRRMSPADKGWLQAVYLSCALLLLVNLERERPNDPLAAAQSLADTAPELGEPHYNLGLELWRVGRLPEAEASLQRAAELLPESSKVFNNWGGVLYDQGRFSEAVERYRTALSLRRPDEERALRSSSPLMPGEAASVAARPGLVYTNLGQALARMGDGEEAVEAYAKALEYEPRSAPAHAGRGLALSNVGRYDEARRAFLTALEIDPSYVSAHINLAGLLAYEGDDEQAAMHYQAALASGDERARQAAAAGLAQLQTTQGAP